MSTPKILLFLDLVTLNTKSRFAKSVTLFFISKQKTLTSEGRVKIEFLPRAAGKTHKAIEYAHEHNGYICTFSKAEAKRVYDLAQKMGKPILMPKTPQDLLHGVRNPFIVDNAEMVLSILLAEKGINFIPMITITDPDDSKLKNHYLNGEWPDKGLL